MGKNGRRGISFGRGAGYADRSIPVPCGTCEGCRVDRVREWGIRLAHEARLHDESVFLTLTYCDESMPRTVLGEPTLDPEHFVLFMKRLRQAVLPVKIRFFQGAEYSPRGRPHHHAIIFGWCPSDGELLSKRPGGNLFRSATIEACWPHGFSSFGRFAPGAAFYVAQYALKKALPERVAPSSREATARVSEYQTMSRRPGIGRGFFERWRGDIFPQDVLVDDNGSRARVPRYYDELEKALDPDGFSRIKAKRKRLGREHSWKDGPSGLARSENLKARRRVFAKRGEV